MLDIINYNPEYEDTKSYISLKHLCGIFCALIIKK